jgi:hypothetical protein
MTKKMSTPVKPPLKIATVRVESDHRDDREGAQAIDVRKMDHDIPVRRGGKAYGFLI